MIKLWGCVAPAGVRGHLRNYFRAPKGQAGDAVRQAHLKNYVDLVGGSFPMQLALALNLPVWAAPLGYGSQPGTVVPTNYTGGRVSASFKVKFRGTWPPDLKQDQWWRISWFFRNQDRGAEYYRDVLKARIDAVEFVEYKKSWFDDAEQRASASLEPGPIPSPADLQDRLTTRIADLVPQSGPAPGG